MPSSKQAAMGAHLQQAMAGVARKAGQWPKGLSAGTSSSTGSGGSMLHAAPALTHRAASLCPEPAQQPHQDFLEASKLYELACTRKHFVCCCALRAKRNNLGKDFGFLLAKKLKITSDELFNPVVNLLFFD